MRTGLNAENRCTWVWVMQTRDVAIVEGLHTFWEFPEPSECLDELCKHGNCSSAFTKHLSKHSLTTAGVFTLSLSHSDLNTPIDQWESAMYYLKLFYDVRYKFCSRSCMVQSEEATTVACNVLLLNLLYVQRKLFSPYAVNCFLVVCWKGVERKSKGKKHSSEQTSKSVDKKDLSCENACYPDYCQRTNPLECFLKVVCWCQTNSHLDSRRVPTQLGARHF